ncbi:protein kinase [Halovenus sp. WSH3]|uniref:Protein kinase n=1 Tax=Halovenus carboxidivorans TaxID=2692199 RepID=A0A6B0T879_9EURY|nr:substrate-binding domain-containing protein [Halovenus carboxidivorans]MXR51512.1 protein kinase [Halovenus carboxidivorans]
MADSAAGFARDAPGVAEAASVREGEYIHVYEGALRGHDEPVRILSLAPEIETEAAAEAFSRTTNEWKNINTQPNVVSVYDRGDEPRPWIAVSDVRGETLDTMQSELSVTAAGTVISDVTEALRSAALYNIAHSDLRPSQIWVVDTESGASGLVGGWGIERAVRTAAGDTLATPYTAPELLETRAADERADVYGLGAIAYYLLTGQSPVAETDGEGLTPPSEIDGSVPSEVDSVVLGALAADPADRPESVYSVGRAVTQALTAETRQTAITDTRSEQRGEEATKSGSPEETGDSGLSRRGVLGGLGVAAVGLGGGWMATQTLADSDTPTTTTAPDTSTREPASSNTTESAPDEPSDSGPLSGEIRIASSDPTYGVVETISDAFREEYTEVGFELTRTGATAGFAEYFVSGDSQIAGSGRPITPPEVERCRNNGFEPVEIPVARGGLVTVVHNENDWVGSMSVERLRQIWSPDTAPTTWSDVDSSWPDVPIHLYGLGPSTEVFDVFTETVLGERGRIRDDFEETERSETIVQAVSQDRRALAYLPFVEYTNNRGQFTALALREPGAEPVEPTIEHIHEGRYPLIRPLFCYVNMNDLQRQAHLQEFLRVCITQSGTDRIPEQTGYAPVPASVTEQNRATLDAATEGEYRWRQ